MKKEYVKPITNIILLSPEVLMESGTVTTSLKVTQGGAEIETGGSGSGGGGSEPTPGSSNNYFDWEETTP